MLVIGVLAGGASCSGSDSDAPGRYNFPRVKEGHQYFMSERTARRYDNRRRKMVKSRPVWLLVALIVRVDERPIH